MPSTLWLLGLGIVRAARGSAVLIEPHCDNAVRVRIAPKGAAGKALTDEPFPNLSCTVCTTIKDF